MFKLSYFYTFLNYFAFITFTLTILEFIYGKYFVKNNNHSTHGTFSNITNGIFYELTLNNLIYVFSIYMLTYLSKFLGFKSAAGEFTVLEFTACLLLSDFVFYVYHVVHHKVNFFWMFHFVHHSDNKLNLATTYRFSLIEKLYLPIMFVVPVFFGFNPYLVVLCYYIMSLYQFMNHSPYINLPRFVEYIFITPGLHNVHHDSEILNKNFGAMFSIWDRFFGTFEPSKKVIHPGVMGYKQENIFKMQIDPIVTYFKKLYNKICR